MVTSFSVLMEYAVEGLFELVCIIFLILSSTLETCESIAVLSQREAGGYYTYDALNTSLTQQKTNCAVKDIPGD